MQFIFIFKFNPGWQDIHWYAFLHPSRKLIPEREPCKGCSNLLFHVVDVTE